MERNQIENSGSLRDVSSPSRFRVKWDAQGLELEERQAGGGYQKIAVSGIEVPPTPLAATHPELEAIIEKTIAHFVNGWLNGETSLDVAVSPPWGSAWLLGLDDIPDDELEDQLEWEIQHRLSSPLDDHIYSWQFMDSQAYAYAIRPELLKFWEKIAEQNNLQLGSIRLMTGLVDDEIEEKADLLPLLLNWTGRGRELGETSVQGGSSDLDDFPDVDEEDEDTLDAILDQGKGKRGKTKKLPLAVIIPAAVIVLVAAGYLFRDSLPIVGKTQTAIANLFTKETPETIAEEIVNTSQFIPVTVGFHTVELPPEIPSFGNMLTKVFDLADEYFVEINSVVFQDNILRCEIGGEPNEIDNWFYSVETIQAIQSITRDASAPLSQGNLFTSELRQDNDLTLSETQFRELATSIGIQARGRFSYMADRSGIMRLFSVLKAEKRRPFRLSVHHLNGDDYMLAMFP